MGGALLIEVVRPCWATVCIDCISWNRVSVMIESDFKGHGVWTILDTIEATLDSFADTAKQDPRYREFCDKAEYVRWILEASSASYFSANELQQTVGELTQVSNHLRSSATNFVHYDQISNFYATIFSRLPYPRVKKIFRSDSNDIIVEFRSTVLEIQQNLTEHVETSQRKLSESEHQVSSLLTTAKKLESSLRDLEHRIEALISNYEAKVNAKVTEKLTEFAGAFSEAQNTRSAEYQANENSMQETISHMKSQAEQIKQTVNDTSMALGKDMDRARVEYESKASDILDNLNGLYDTAGQTALAVGFAGSAKEESLLFSRYSVLASIIFVIVAIISACMWFSLSKTANFTFAEMLMRLPVSAVFLVPGLYLASLANKHRKSAVKLRSLSLRIKAFDAYLANAPIEQRHQLRSELVREFFEEKPDTPSRESRLAGKDNGSLIDLLRKTIDQLR